MTENLIFAADTLMTELHVAGDKVWGRSKKELPFGPCLLHTHIEAFSNALGQRDASFLVQVTKTLWLFLVAGKSRVLYVIDGAKAGLTEHNAPSYGGTTWIATLKELAEREAVTRVFKYVEQQGWEKANLKKELPL